MAFADQAAERGAAVAKLWGRAVERLTPVGTGRNSRVFRVEGADGSSCAAKFYFRHPADLRDRQSTEFGALSFLWERGVREIAQPLSNDPQAGVALYEFLEGKPAGETLPGDADIKAAALFLERLRVSAADPAARALAPASEACFSLEALDGNLRARLARLGPAREKDPVLDAYMCGELEPAMERYIDAALLAKLEPLAEAQRALSPSDFGFHNAIRAPRGLSYVDFEYFGWDDPAKTLSDFVLHPAMGLTSEQGRLFARAYLARAAEPAALRARWRALLPLYGVKWCLILLNEFVAADRDRRRFAAGAGGEQTQAGQLAKSRDMLARLARGAEKFPYD